MFLLQCKNNEHMMCTSQTTTRGSVTREAYTYIERRDSLYVYLIADDLALRQSFNQNLGVSQEAVIFLSHATEKIVFKHWGH